MSFTRRPLLGMIVAAAAALTLGACQGGGAYTPTNGDIALGAEDAPITVVEYFSVTCGACQQFHTNVFPTIKEQFIDTGRVRWVYRELLTAPRPVALAGFQIARCGQATPEQYAARISVMFDRQSDIIGAAQMGGAAAVRERLSSIGLQAGLSQEQIDACMADPTGQERVRGVDEQAQADEVSGTPTLILNGEVLRDANQYTVEGLSALLSEGAGATP